MADFGNVNGASGGSNSSSRAASQLGSTDSVPVKEWHKSITQDLRNHLVNKFVQAIFPTPDPNILKDVRIKNLVQCSKKVEGYIYETANTRKEYYDLLAENIHRIQRELEEKKMKRSLLENPQLQTQLHNSSSIRFPVVNLRQPMPNDPSNSAPRQPNMQATTRNSTPVPNILVSSNDQTTPSPNCLTSFLQQIQDILMKHQRIDQQFPQSRMFQASTWPANHATTTSVPMSSPAQMGTSGFLSPTSGFMPPSSANSDFSTMFSMDSIKKEFV